MTRPARTRSRHHASAIRLAIALCEADHARPRTSPAAARAALRAAGLAPHLAATLRGRLRLIPEQEPHR